MNYCSQCGAPVQLRVPPGDDRPAIRSPARFPLPMSNPASPAIWKFDDQAWTWRTDCQRKHVMEHCSLLGDISRFPEGVAEGPVQIQEARHASRNGYFLHESQTYRRHAPGFDLSGEQFHGPRADGSGGHQERQVDIRLADAEDRGLYLAARHVGRGRGPQRRQGSQGAA